VKERVVERRRVLEGREKRRPCHEEKVMGRVVEERMMDRSREEGRTMERKLCREVEKVGVE
jgi:hypothetical protein